MPALSQQSQRRAFLALLGAAFVVCAFVVRPVWVPLFLGALIAVVVMPWHRRALARFHGRHAGLLALGLVAASLFALLAVASLLVFVVVSELVPLTQRFVAELQASNGATLYSGRIGQLLSRAGFDRTHLAAQANEVAQWAATHVAPVVSGVLSVTATSLLTTIIAALTAFYLLVDGDRLLRWVEQLSPLPVEQTRALYREFRDVARATLYGNGVTATYQGVAALVGYWIFRVPQAGVWAALTAVFSFVPGLGTAIVWVPVGVVLLATGHTLAGVGVLVYSSALVVLLADYWLRPRLVGGKMRLHSLLVFLSIFGGLEVFGLPGLVAGPLCLALLAAMLRIYEREYRAVGPRAPLRPAGRRIVTPDEAAAEEQQPLFDEPHPAH